MSNNLIWMAAGLVILWAIGQVVEAWSQYICRIKSEELFESLQPTER
jgi:hypothetical protein